MNNNPIQAIVRNPSTVAATFTGKPSDAARERMKRAGAEFKNGQWVLTISPAALVDEEDAVKAFEALATLAESVAA